ncbi:MAG: hypothetical protein ACLFUS_11445 [Candidatus Sumerlaeia bacterium]
MNNHFTKTFIILITALLLSMASIPVPAQAPPPPPPIGGVPGGGPGDDAELPDQGQTDNFVYERSTEHPGTYVVYPSGDSDMEPFIISENMFRIHMRNERLDDANRLKFMSDYPKMVTSMYENTMENHFPDKSTTYDDAFEEQVLVGSESEGVNALVKQDPSLNPYVQIILEDENGEIHEYTLSRKTAERILGNNRLSNDDKIRALRTHPFHLPQEARQQFDQLDQQELWNLLEEVSPGVKKQEFVKMTRIFREEEAKREMAQADQGNNAAPTPEAETELRPETTPLAPAATATPPAVRSTPLADADQDGLDDAASGMNWPFAVAVFVGLVVAIVVFVQLGRRRS